MQKRQQGSGGYIVRNALQKQEEAKFEQPKISGGLSWRKPALFR